MGYHIFMRASMFTIKASDVPMARAALRSARPDLPHNSLDDALAALGWEITFSPEGDVDGIDFVGEKYRADEDPLLAIAPFVEDGSYIEMQGEGGEMWRWAFRDGRLYELEAEIIWSETEIAAPVLTGKP
ncbi:MAG: hypothetical protein H6812_04440 [Phycisphaeraceae bacterium]|nr:hypothetical protein [Phycisphaerales bacterium]MCB9842486.1 hypothetical protein [Phycisphaeraceae bacterium]